MITAEQWFVVPPAKSCVKRLKAVILGYGDPPICGEPNDVLLQNICNAVCLQKSWCMIPPETNQEMRRYLCYLGYRIVGSLLQFISN